MKRLSPPPAPEAGDVFIGESRCRIIVASGNGFVLYNNGGAQRECSLQTFKAWVRRQRAVKRD